MQHTTYGSECETHKIQVHEFFLWVFLMAIIITITISISITLSISSSIPIWFHFVLILLFSSSNFMFINQISWFQHLEKRKICTKLT